MDNKKNITLILGILVVTLAVTGIAGTQKQDTTVANHGKTVSKPEEHGEDLSRLPASDAVSKLCQSKDRVERRKLAKVIGDRSKNGRLALTPQEEKAVAQIVVDTLQQAKSSVADEREEARQQIERLWHAAVPTLIANLQTNDLTMAELAAKSLILMRNETILKTLVAEAKSETEEGRRQLLLFTLSKMKEQRKSLIPGRECLDEKESEKLFEQHVAPALEELKKRSPRTP